MNERKNIDRLFQEKFKDFEVAPPEFVWENIREVLEEKKKRRVIPIWIRLSGVAAVLLISGVLVTLFFNESNSKTNTNPVVIETQNATPKDPLQTAPNSTTTDSGTSSGSEAGTNAGNSANDSDVNTAVANGNDNTNNSGTNANGAGINTIIKTGTPLPVFNTKNNTVANKDHNANAAGMNKNNGKRIKQNKATIQQGEAFAVSQGSQKTSGKENKNANAANDGSTFNKTGTAQNTLNEGIANTNKKSSINNQTVAPNNRLNEQSKQTDGTKNILPATKEGIANNTNNSGNSAAKTISDKTAIDTATKQGNTIIDKNIPATEAMAQTVVDTAATVVPENELEKLLREKLSGKKDEDKAVAEKSNKSKWNVKPQVAPIFFSSLSEGSPINEQFASNSKTYDNDMSFGVGVNYALSDRITIRTGINTVNLNYATNDIAFHASLNGQTSNIIETRNTANIVIQNANTLEPATFIIDGQPSQAVNGSMMQKTGYLEVPLEMSYALINKKFGIDVIGGVSTLFLNQNNVSVVSSEGLSTQVGQAENLNNVHFSTNIGVGFKYRFWDSFEANFEPMFKYQVNTFSRDAGNFKPYFIGLYSGVSFSF
ncbi:outer membrane beta-barrel protein [Flavobacterium cerinum]|uniref:Outer membrane protein beta-barrel domain-containing protein n=1 Tax=Flavobacterium cerinum TaxID=2502784 RepID=A0A3S3U033_9FLAO|nr:outer membrane beta-barrel protein [Flavobacterium cerinum]RWX00018.1 hypothetical protein EPI11_10770 [Flavobacterium cerinum]